MKYIQKNYEKVWEKKNDVKVGVAKMRTKTFFFILLNARWILKLMLCNWNLTKLVYLTLLSFDCRAWALKFSELLQKKIKCPIKIGPKGH